MAPSIEKAISHEESPPDEGTPQELTPLNEDMPRGQSIPQPSEEESHRNLTCQSSYREGCRPNDDNDEEHILITDSDDQRSDTKDGTYAPTLSSMTRPLHKSSDCDKAVERQVEEDPLSKLYDQEQDEDLLYDDIQIAQDESTADTIEW